MQPSSLCKRSAAALFSSATVAAHVLWISVTKWRGSCASVSAAQSAASTRNSTSHTATGGTPHDRPNTQRKTKPEARVSALPRSGTCWPRTACSLQTGADALATAVQLGSVAHQGDGGRATYTRPMAARRRPTPCRLAQAHAARWLLAQASADMAGPSCPPLRHGVGIPSTPRSVWRRRGAGKAHLADIAMHLPRNKAQGSH